MSNPISDYFRQQQKKSAASRWAGLSAAERSAKMKAVRAAAYFRCPSCGGSTFGRDTKAGADGQVVALATVRCHDEHEKGCKWRGEWPARP